MKIKKPAIMLAFLFFSQLTACAQPSSFESIPHESIPAVTDTAGVTAASLAEESPAAETPAPAAPEKGAASETEEKQTEQAEATDIPEGDGQEGPEMAAYAAALEEIYTNHTFPDGKDFGFDGFHDMSENKFAVYDIDSDGKKELIVLYTTTYMAGMTGTVYAYDSSSGTLRAELQEFPLLTFYDNGAVVAEWSHNQGMAGDFWPYTVYSYNSGTDTYEQTAMVDAWDKSVGEKDYEGNSFPDDIDADGDGLVYYIMPGGTYEKNTPVDFEEYTKWRESSIGQAQPLEIPYLELTEDNIKKL